MGLVSCMPIIIIYMTVLRHNTCCYVVCAKLRYSTRANGWYNHNKKTIWHLVGSIGLSGIATHYIITKDQVPGLYVFKRSKGPKL